MSFMYQRHVNSRADSTPKAGSFEIANRYAFIAIMKIKDVPDAK